MKLSPFNKYSTEDGLLALEIFRLLFVLQIFFGVAWDCYQLGWLALSFQTFRTYGTNIILCLLQFYCYLSKFMAGIDEKHGPNVMLQPEGRIAFTNFAYLTVAYKVSLMVESLSIFLMVTRTIQILRVNRDLHLIGVVMD